MEADGRQMAKTMRCQYDDRRDPTHCGNVAKNGGGSRGDVRQRIVGQRRWWARCSGILRLSGAAIAAKCLCGAYRVPALAAKRHLYVFTLCGHVLFRQAPI